VGERVPPRKNSTILKQGNFSDKRVAAVFAFDDFGHFFGGGETIIVDADDGNDFRDVVDEYLIVPVEVLEVFESNAGFDVSLARADAFERAFGTDIKVNDDVWLAHEVAHVAEELNVGAVVALFHEAGFGKHGGENGILVDGAVLNGRFAVPDDFLVLLKAPGEEVDLRGKGVLGRIAVKVFEVLVVFDRFVVGFDAEVLGEACGQSRLSGADHAGDANKEIFHGFPYRIFSFSLWGNWFPHTPCNAAHCLWVRGKMLLFVATYLVLQAKVTLSACVVT